MDIVPIWLPEYKPSKDPKKNSEKDMEMPGEGHGASSVDYDVVAGSNKVSQDEPAEKELKPFDYHTEIERLQLYRDRINSRLKAYNDGDALGLLVQAYSQALEQEMSLRDRCEAPSPAKKSKITVGKMRKLK